MLLSRFSETALRLLQKGADRVIMGYVGTTHHYLGQAIKALKENGGILHYHETVPENLAMTRPEERVKKLPNYWKKVGFSKPERLSILPESCMWLWTPGYPNERLLKKFRIISPQLDFR